MKGANVNEYRITPYLNEKEVGQEEYFYNRNEAIRYGKSLLKDGVVDEVDLQVIYNHQDPNSELSHAWWSITRDGVKKMLDDI